MALLLTLSSRVISHRGDTGLLATVCGVPVTGVRVPMERVDCGVFSGDKDRSRSGTNSAVSVSVPVFRVSPNHTKLSLQSRVTILDDLSLQLLNPFLVLLLSLIGKVADGLQEGLRVKVGVGHNLFCLVGQGRRECGTL